jgi:hypothetical protein
MTDDEGGQEDGPDEDRLGTLEATLVGSAVGTSVGAFLLVGWSRGLGAASPAGGGGGVELTAVAAALGASVAAFVLAHDRRREPVLHAAAGWTTLLVLPAVALVTASRDVVSWIEVQIFAVALVTCVVATGTLYSRASGSDPGDDESDRSTDRADRPTHS